MHSATKAGGWLMGMSLEVRCLCVISFISAVGFGIQSPAIPVFGQKLGVGTTAVGLIIAAFPLARLLMAWPSGLLTDRFGEYRLVVFGLLLMAAASVTAAFSTSAHELMFYRGLCGVGSVLYSISAMSLLLRTVDPNVRGKATGLFMGAYYIGTISGPAIGSLFVDMSVRLPFIIYGAGAGAAGLVAAVLLDPKRSILLFFVLAIPGWMLVLLSLLFDLMRLSQGDGQAAADIAGRSPSAVRGAKQLINRLSNAGAAEHFAAEREIIFTLIGKPHQVEAITANFENRAPVFKDVG